VPVTNVVKRDILPVTVVMEEDLEVSAVLVVDVAEAGQECLDLAAECVVEEEDVVAEFAATAAIASATYQENVTLIQNDAIVVIHLGT